MSPRAARVRTMGLVVLLPLFASTAHGQAVQLPTFQSFSASSTVSVPDRGSITLGGVRRGADGSVSRGVPLLGRAPGVNRLFQNRAIGSTRGSSNLQVHATIIDLDELDRAVLAAAASRRQPATVEDLQLARQADFLSRNVARGPQAPVAAERGMPIASVEQIRRANQLAAERQQSEASEYLNKARHAEAAGKLGLAKIYYQMVARRTSGSQREILLAHIQTLQEPPRSAIAKAAP